jgi:ABC-type dipeptide/oligopeptide/nickel transport system ATPase component
MPEFLLNVRGLETQFKTPDGIVLAVNGVGLEEEEILCYVEGQSG